MSFFTFCWWLLGNPKYFFAGGVMTVLHRREVSRKIPSKMHYPLLVRKCKTNTLVFYQSWLLVWILKDLLGVMETIAEGNAAAGLLFNRFVLSLLFHKQQLASCMTSKNLEEEESENNSAFNMRVWFARNCLYCFYIVHRQEIISSFFSK